VICDMVFPGPFFRVAILLLSRCEPELFFPDPLLSRTPAALFSRANRSPRGGGKPLELSLLSFFRRLPPDHDAALLSIRMICRSGSPLREQPSFQLRSGSLF